MLDQVPALTVPRGVGKVELFNERGKLVERIPFENEITPHGEEYLRWVQRFGIAASAPGNVNGSGDPLLANPFMAIFLSTSDEVEGSAYSGWPLGNYVGWANKHPYAGAGVYRGSPNQDELVFNTSVSKWVFDWSTTQALGTFRSVGFGSAFLEAATATDTIAYNYPLVNYKNRVNLLAQTGVCSSLTTGNFTASGSTASDYTAGGMHQDRVSGDWYLGGGGAGSTPRNTGVSALISGSNPEDWGNNTGTIRTSYSGSNAQHSLGSAYQTNGEGGITTDATYVYRCGGPRITRITKANWTSTSPTPTIMTTDPSWTSIRSLSMEPGGTYMWVAEVTTNRVYRVASSNLAIDRQWTMPPGMTIRSAAHDPVRGLVWAVLAPSSLNQYVLAAFDLTGNIISMGGLTARGTALSSYRAMFDQREGVVGANPTTSAHPIVAIGNSGEIYVSDTNGSGPNLFQINPMSLGSRALLPSPVTKTSMQSLKVTYEFQYS